VFALVDRLEDAGADLLEFVGGAGEVLRALLMLQVGARPEGLTEPLAQALVRYQARLPAGDLLRMLKLLGESEALVRRSASPRLAVETLLLRWALMDRTVDLEAVLAGSATAPRPGSTTEGAEPRDRRSDSALPETADPAPAAAPSTRSARRQSAPLRLEFTLESLLAGWPDLVAAGREESRFLGEALAAAQPRSVEPPNLLLAVAEGNPIHLEALGRQREAVERLLGQAVGAEVRLTLADPAAGGAVPARPRRLNEAEARAERLKLLKARDPALEAAADSLDLEVLE
jgi:DNA polymerase-3 subunit gamma/tau